MNPWRLAKALDKLRSQINALAPHRSKISDGGLGDQAHRARVSDHNPDNLGRVCAFDFTHDPVNGCDGNTLSQALINDPRVKYVIWKGRIWKARTGKWEMYRGANPHNHHVHVSVTPVGADDDREWELSTPKLQMPTLKRGNRGAVVKIAQALLRIEDDGVFGSKTEAAVKEFQKANGLTPDGVVGVRTWRALNKANPQIP